MGGVCVSREIKGQDEELRDFFVLNNLWKEVNATLSDPLEFREKCVESFRIACDNSHSDRLTRSVLEGMTEDFICKLACDDESTKESIYRALDSMLPASSDIEERTFKEFFRIVLILLEQDLRRKLDKYRADHPGTFADTQGSKSLRLRGTASQQDELVPFTEIFGMPGDGNPPRSFGPSPSATSERSDMESMKQCITKDGLCVEIYNHQTQPHWESSRLILNMDTGYLEIQSEDRFGMFSVNNFLSITQGISEHVLPEPPLRDYSMAFAINNEGNDLYICVLFDNALKCQLAVGAFNELLHPMLASQRHH